MGRTKDESFVLHLYEIAKKQSDVYSSVDRYVVGKEIGMHPKGVDTICKTLLRTNFIKQEEENKIHLTENGVRLAELLKHGN